MAVYKVTQRVNDAVSQSNLITIALMKALDLDKTINVNMSVDEVAEYIADALTSGGGQVIVDSELSHTSTHPVQNKVITDALDEKVDILTTAPLTANESGKFAIVMLDSEPANKYDGYLYIIDTGTPPTPSDPTTIEGNTIVLGANESINGNIIELGEDATITGNTINF